MRDSQIGKAVAFLLNDPALELSATRLKHILQLPCQESTLGRKLRLKASQGILQRSYKRIDSGEEIAVYSSAMPTELPEDFND